MKFKNIWLMLILCGMLIFGLAVAGCEPEEEMEEEVGVEEEIEEEIEEEELDEDEVLREAADDYFAQVAEDNNMTEPDEVYDALDYDPESIFILDIRGAEDFEEGHIEGAYHSGVEEVAEIMENIPQDQEVFITCYSGQNAG